MAGLLGPRDPDPVLAIAGGEASRWLLVVDHAGNAVPEALDGLGVTEADRNDHIGIDIGVWAVSRRLAVALAAPAIGQAYSRLVIDCNRQPGTPSSVPVVSDGRRIPGNEGADTAARVAEIFVPYHAAIAARCEEWPALLCAMHSFTRTLAGVRREVDIGLIHGPDGRLAEAVQRQLQGCGLRVRRNVPYRIDFAGDYTLPVHGERAGRGYVEIEVCQDLIGDDEGQRRIAALLAPALRAAQESFS